MPAGSEVAGPGALVGADDDLVLPAGLTPAQREAIVAPDPLLCVLAGAGTGKTRVLTLRVAWRVLQGHVDPDKVLVCTFSRKAADELGRRLWALQVGDGVRAGTFHRTALSLLAQHRADRGLPAPVVLPDRRGLLATIVPETRAGASGDEDSRRPGERQRNGARGRRPALVAQLDVEIGWAKARLLRPADYAQRAAAMGRRTVMPAEQIADLYQRYEVARRRDRSLDFDDLLSVCADVLHDDGRFADAVRWRYRHLFVDEMQDVNPAQFRLLAALLGDEPDLMVVGDPNQSVYGWNGADPSLIGDLPNLLPGMRVIRLNENHRCTPQVVAVASAALGLDLRAADAPEPPEARPSSTRPDGPVPRIVAHEHDTAEAEWVAREVWMARRPGGRWSDIAVLARTNAQLDHLAAAFDRAQLPYRQAGTELAPGGDARGVPTRWPGEPPGAPGWTDEGEQGPAPRSRVIGEDDDGDGDGVVLATFHRAKGLQWPTVFVVGLSAGLVPIASARDELALAEERRLLYVALTRAESDLICTWARFRDGAGTGTPRKASPWIEPMARAVDRMQRESRPLGPSDAAVRVGALRALLDPSGAPPPGEAT